MQKEKIILSSIAVVCMFLPKRGFIAGCDWWEYIIYMFFHAGVLHLLFNLYSLWVLKSKGSDLIKAFAIASVCSPICTMDIPTIGMSGLVYALFGMNVLSAKNNISLYGWISVVICLSTGFFIKNANAHLHITCFIIGYITELISACKRDYDRIN